MKKNIIVLILFLISLNSYGAGNGVCVIDKEKAIKHVRGYEEYENIKSIEDEKFDRRIKRETQILTEKLEKFKYESPNMAPSVKAVKKDELVKYGNSLKALEAKMKVDRDKILSKKFLKIEKSWKKFSKSYFRKIKAKVVFRASDNKLIFRGKGVTPLTIRVLKTEKVKKDITDDFIEFSDKIVGRKKEKEVD
ncbi:MAG: hypothetical protein KC493_16865 [Bacteriovoracaceae bacterium]|nr:hypothetical protein [Bacteriovoracaceae bacterium]